MAARWVTVAALAAEIGAGARPVAVLAGAGVSCSAGVATGQELLLRLAEARGHDAGPDPVDWYVTASDGFPDYFGMLLDDPASDRLPGEHFERPAPTPAHRALAALVAGGWVGPILTTNLDRLLERALASAGLAVDVAFDIDAMARLPCPIPAGRPVLLKLHGDYRDIGIRHTAPLHSYHPVVEALLDGVLGRHDLLVSGWSSSWDVPLRQAVMRHSSRRLLWLQCGAPSQAARQVFAARNSVVAPVAGSDAGLTALADVLLAPN